MTTTDTSEKQVAEATVASNNCYLQDDLKTDLKNLSLSYVVCYYDIKF